MQRVTESRLESSVSEVSEWQRSEEQDSMHICCTTVVVPMTVLVAVAVAQEHSSWDAEV